VEVVNGLNKAIKKEWVDLKVLIEKINNRLPRVLKEYGETYNACADEVSAVSRADPAMKPKPYQMSLDTPLEIRRSRYEMEVIFDHQHTFLQHFADALVAADPDTHQIATSVEAALAAKPSVVTPVASTIVAPAPSTPSAPIAEKTAVCLCKHHFLNTDAPAIKNAHLKSCGTFQKAPQAQMNALLRNLGFVPSTPTGPRAMAPAPDTPKRVSLQGRSKYAVDNYVSPLGTREAWLTEQQQQFKELQGKK
jgi:hypothetical protein